MMRKSKDGDFKKLIKISSATVFVLTVLAALFSLSRGTVNFFIMLSPLIPGFLLFAKFPRVKMPKYLVISCFISLFTALLFCGLGNSLKPLQAISLLFITSSIFHLSMVFPEEKSFYSKSGFLFVRIFYFLSFVFSSFFFFISTFLSENFEIICLKCLYVLALSAYLFLVLTTSRFASKKCSVTMKKKFEHFLIGAFLSVFLWFLFSLFLPEANPLFFVFFALLFLLEDLFPDLKRIPSRKLIVFFMSILLSSASFLLISFLPVSVLKLGKWKIFVLGMLGSLFLAWSFKFFYSIVYLVLYGNPVKRIHNLITFDVNLRENESTLEFAQRIRETLLSCVGCERCDVFVRRKNSFVGLLNSEDDLFEVFDASRKDGLVNFLESTAKPVIFEEETSTGFRNLSVEDMLQVKKKEGHWILPFFSGWEMTAFAMGGRPRNPMDKTLMDSLTAFSRRISGVLTALIKIDNLSGEIKREEKRKIREEIFKKLQSDTYDRVQIRKIKGDNPDESAFFLFKKSEKIFCGFLKWVPDKLDWLKISRLENLTHEFRPSNLNLNSYFRKITSLEVIQSALIIIDSNNFEIASENCEALFCFVTGGVKNCTPDLQSKAKRIFLSSTDIFDLRNVKYEKMGKERIINLLSSHKEEDFESFVENVFREIDAWAANASGLKDTEIMFVDL